MANLNRTTKRGTQILSLQEARAVALNAQAFGKSPVTKPTRASLAATVRKIGLLQLDSVNVLIRSHYLPLFSRLGPYDTAILDRMSNHAPRALYEYWGHEASLIPVEYYPLFQWRMDDARAGQGVWAGPSRIARERSEFVMAVLAEIEVRGPLGAGELSNGGKSTGNWWGWSDGKRALEYLFWTGQVTSAGRRKFERLYDLPERVLPKKILEAPTPSRIEAQQRLMLMAAKAHGVATEADLRDYFRLPAKDAKERLNELVEQGLLCPISVEGWNQPAFIPRQIKIPAAIEACALLSPFDPLIWMRPRTERLFNFHYRLAFYTPKHKRTHGYYVMPFLCGTELLARVDLKADRKRSRLLVLAGHAEHERDLPRVALPLKQQLLSLAHWLGLEKIAIKSRTELAQALRRG